jgi:hypothetical protein
MQQSESEREEKTRRVVDVCAREAWMEALRYEGEEKPSSWLDESDAAKNKWRAVARAVLTTRSAVAQEERAIAMNLRAAERAALPFWRRWFGGC